MYIERTFVLNAPIDRTWAFLNEPQEVGACLPGCHTVDIVAPGKYKATVGLKVGPIKAGFDVQVETSEERPPEFASYTMKGSDGDGSSKISADCTLALKALDDGKTEVTYTSKVNIVGKLGKFAGGVMKKLADSINDQFISALTDRLNKREGIAEDPKESGGMLGKLKSLVK